MAAVQRKVSVIVPTCDRPMLLREALASIRALEGHDLTFEILVCDNGTVPENSGRRQGIQCDLSQGIDARPECGSQCGLAGRHG